MRSMSTRKHCLLSLSALLLGALLPLAAFAAPASAGPPVAGEDYEEIAGGKPFMPAKDGRIEVAEVFAYWCPHCHDFQPRLEAWARNQRDVRLTYVPMSNDDGDAFARGYFATLDAGAIPRLHDALFRAVHDDQTVPTNPTIAELATFYGTQGLDAARMQAAMSGPAMAARVAAARQFALRSGVEGTPTLVIAGRYRVKGNSLDAILDNAGRLIAQLRAGKR